MNLKRFFIRAAALVLLGNCTLVHGAVTAALTPEQKDFFENKIRPILNNSCLECHSGEKGKIKGGLNLDSRELLLKGGESGPGFKEGDVNKSAVIKAITWEDDLQMPPKKKLSAEEIALLEEEDKRMAEFFAAALEMTDLAVNGLEDKK